MLDSSSAVQLTFALTAGLGCGILIGALWASRRRRAVTPPSHVVSRPLLINRDNINFCEMLMSS